MFTFCSHAYVRRDIVLVTHVNALCVSWGVLIWGILPVQVTYSGQGPVGEDDVWSAFNLRFSGTCRDASLGTYGQGISGRGPTSSA